MRSSIASPRAKRTRQLLRYAVLLLVGLLLSMFAPPAPRLSALPRSLRHSTASLFDPAYAAGTTAGASALLPTLDRQYDLEGLQTAKLLPADVIADSLFGLSLAISGSTLVVGARGGRRVYVYARDQLSGAWQQTTQLGPGAQAGADIFFPESVAIDGDFIVVGSDEPSPWLEGAAYVYGRNRGGPNNWGLVAKLQAHDPGVYAYFGNSVAISGDTIVVGAWGDSGGASESGAAYVFERNQGGTNQWGETAKLMSAEPVPWERLGVSVAIDSDRIAVGAPHARYYNSDPGSTYIFERDTAVPGAWRQSARLSAGDASTADEFGNMVALSGDTLAVEALGSNAIYLYERNAGGAAAWGEVRKLNGSEAAPGGGFGSAMALRGTRLVAGGWGFGGPSHSGVAYVYDRDFGGAGRWGARTRLQPQNEPTYDSFGSAVAFNGDEIVVGDAIDDDHGLSSGSAFAFHLYPRPHTQDDTAATDEDTPATIDVLSNDSTPAGTGSLELASVSVVAGPAHGLATVSPASGTITYTPGRDFNGTDSLVYSVANTVGTSQTAVVTITVRPVNDAPEFASAAPTTATAYSIYRYDVIARDIDGVDNLAISAPIKPTWLTLDATGNGSATLSGSPTDSDVGEQAVRLQVTDAGGLSATQTFTIAVAANAPPHFVSAPPTYAKEGIQYIYPISAADPDTGQALTITAPVLPAWLQLAKSLQATTVLSGTPDYTAVGDHVVRLRVEDPGGLSDTQTFTITVQAARPSPPTNLVAVPSSASAIKLTWRDTSSDELGFSVERRSSDAAWARVATVGAGQTAYVDQDLQCGLAYDYRVSAFNQHWSSDPSNTASASPNELAVRSFSFGGPPAQILAANQASASIAVADPGAIADLDVQVEIDHIYDADLVLVLTAPDGSVVLLSAYNGEPGRDYVGTIFDDEATTSIGSGYPPFSGHYRPLGSLSALYGKPLAGTWTLTVHNAGGFVGELRGFKLDFTATAGCPNVPPTPTFTPTPTATPTATPTSSPTAAPSSTPIGTPTSTPTPRPATTFYVDAAADGTNDGTSWANAFTRLQDALAAAWPGDNLWVAGGTYKPAADGNRSATFQLVSGVALYGGFAGSETALDQRDWQANQTVLSGDLGVAGDPSDNSLVVMSSTGAQAGTIVDGFTIADGGVGLRNDHSSPTLRNLAVRDNGQGMNNSYSNPQVTNVSFSNNVGGYNGGGMSNDHSRPALRHVTFTGNAGTYGAGMYSSESDPTLNDVTFAGNIASFDGGGIYSDWGTLALGNVTFSDNTAGQGGGIYTAGGGAYLSNVTFQRNRAIATYGRGGAIYSWSNSVTLTDASFSHNSATSAGGAMYHQGRTATLRRVTFDTNTAVGGGGGMALVGSYATLNDVTFDHNAATAATAEGGAMDVLDSCSANLTNARFLGNSAGMRGGALAIDFSCGAQLINTLFSGNSALAEDGGGIYNLGALKVYNSTFWHNTAQKNGGALFNNLGGIPIRNSIFWENAAGGEGPQIYSTIWPDIDVQYSLVQGGYAGAGNIAADPLFVSSAGGDGVAGTLDDDLHLRAGSPAVDAGRNTDVPAGTLADLDGNGRFADDPGVVDTGAGAPPLVDLGAYERLAGIAPTPTSTPTATSTPTPTNTPTATATPIPPLPMAVNVNSSADTGDGQLSEGEIVRVPIQSLSVTFNTDISYFKRRGFLLLAEGDQPGFQTTSCARPSPDDRIFFSNFQSFQFLSRTIILGFYIPERSTLPDGRYRFIVCETVTGTYPLLDGDGDGTAGGDLVRNFSVDQTSPTATATPTSTATATATSTPTATATATSTATAMTTSTPTATAILTSTAIATATSTPTASATAATPTSIPLSPAQLSIDYTVARPGSSFTVTGAAFPPNAHALVAVNGVELGGVTSDSMGALRFFLETSAQSAPGYYRITVMIDSSTSGLQHNRPSAECGYSLRMDSILRTHGSDEQTIALAVPADIWPQAGFRIYMPFVKADSQQ